VCFGRLRICLDSLCARQFTCRSSPENGTCVIRIQSGRLCSHRENCNRETLGVWRGGEDHLDSERPLSARDQKSETHSVGGRPTFAGKAACHPLHLVNLETEESMHMRSGSTAPSSDSRRTKGGPCSHESAATSSDPRHTANGRQCNEWPKNIEMW
jgi:hypothetical protein